MRIGASEIVLRDYLPPVLQAVRTKVSQTEVTLREGYQPQLESWLQSQESISPSPCSMQAARRHQRAAFVNYR